MPGFTVTHAASPTQVVVKETPRNLEEVTRRIARLEDGQKQLGTHMQELNDRLTEIVQVIPLMQDRVREVEAVVQCNEIALKEVAEQISAFQAPPSEPFLHQKSRVRRKLPLPTQTETERHYHSQTAASAAHQVLDNGQFVPAQM